MDQGTGSDSEWTISMNSSVVKRVRHDSSVARTRTANAGNNRTAAAAAAIINRIAKGRPKDRPTVTHS